MTELRRTPLYDQHQELDAKLVDFGGWALPVNYGSQVTEHHAVRKDAGMFDVSHMTVSDIYGAQTHQFLSYLLANDIAKAKQTPGKALYSCMLNERGGVIDDLIAYVLSDDHCRLVTNAATNEKDMGWISQQAESFDVEFHERPELALIAVQGPNAIAQCQSPVTALFDEYGLNVVNSLQRFQGAFLDSQSESFVGRTGYTGEDGLEFILPAETAIALWQQLVAQGVQACGLGARDTLRLESGMSLYGNDLDENHTPAESGIAWSVAKSDDRQFIGKDALQNPPRFSMVGLVLLDRGVLRGHQEVYQADSQIGEITSGTFSPTLEQSIALARVNRDAKLAIGDTVQIAVRNKRLSAEVVRFPFVKDGQATR
jgi:aminomethyltransferase